MEGKLEKVVSKLIFVVVLCPVIRSSIFNIEELQKSKYGVEISSEPVLLKQGTDENTMKVISKHGQPYQCVLPVLHVKSEDNSSKNIPTKEITVLLEPFNSTCLYLLDGWWTYKVCFGLSVYQYHEEGTEVKDNISLGHYTGDTDYSQVTLKENKKVNQRYHSQFYSNGTLCDLTGELRRTEVRFYCDSQGADHIARIDERSTCVYVISVHTSKLCNHSYFRPPKSPKKHSITCSPALLDDQFRKYTEAKKRSEEDDESIDELSSPKSGEVEEDEGKPKKRTPSIFEALAKIFSKKARGNKQEEDESIDWGDVLKTSRDAIDKSAERIRKLHLHKKLKYEADAMDEEINSEKISEIPEQSMKEGERVSSKPHYAKAKDAETIVGDYYQDMIEGLKTQYRIFKKEMEIVTKDLYQKIERLENGRARTSPVAVKLAERIRAILRRFEEKLRFVDFEMKRLIDLTDNMVENPNYAKANKEIAGIRSKLTKLVEKITSRADSSTDDGNDDHDVDKGKKQDENDRAQIMQADIQKNVKSERKTRDSEKKDQLFDMQSPKLDKVVSKVKKMMTQETDGDFEDEKETDEDIFDDDRISVRVTKIKDKGEDLYDETEDSLFTDDDTKELEELRGNEEMKTATKKMENMVRKQLQEAGIKHEGKVKVKIITSKDALKRVAGGHSGFQILTPQETNEFRDLLSNLLGGGRERLKEKERQEKLEENYNLIWGQDGFTSVKKEYSSMNHENNDNE